LVRQCIFCGSTSDLTREHVLPDWLTEIGDWIGSYTGDCRASSIWVTQFAAGP